MIDLCKIGEEGTNHRHPYRTSWRLPWTQRSVHRWVDLPLWHEYYCCSFFLWVDYFFLPFLSEVTERERLNKHVRSAFKQFRQNLPSYINANPSTQTPRFFFTINKIDLLPLPKFWPFQTSRKFLPNNN